MKYLVLSLFLSITASAQISNLTIHSKDSKNIEVIDGKKTYKYDFLFPEASAIDSYFIKADGNLFYIKYEYKGSAKSTYFITAEFKWKDEKISLTNYVRLNNQQGKWSGVVNFLSGYIIKDFQGVQDMFFTVENDEQILVSQNSQEVTMLDIPRKIDNKLFLKDKVFFEILSEAKAKLK